MENLDELKKRYTELGIKIKLFTTKRERTADLIQTLRTELAYFDNKINELNKQLLETAEKLINRK